MIAGRILPADVSAFEAARVAREDASQIFIAPRGQVVIARHRPAGCECYGAPGRTVRFIRRERGYGLAIVEAILLCCSLFFIVGFFAGLLAGTPK